MATTLFLMINVDGLVGHHETPNEQLIYAAIDEAFIRIVWRAYDGLAPQIKTSVDYDRIPGSFLDGFQQLMDQCFHSDGFCVESPSATIRSRSATRSSFYTTNCGCRWNSAASFRSTATKKGEPDAFASW